MSNPSKAKGTRWNTAVVNYLRTWWPKAERRALAGADDLGDVINVPAVVECKDAKRHELAGWMDETEVERVNAGEEFGMLVVKRARKPVELAYAIFPLKQAVELLRRSSVRS